MATLSVSTETWQAWKATYKSKLLLLLLIWLCHPSTKLATTKADAKTDVHSLALAHGQRSIVEPGQTVHAARETSLPTVSHVTPPYRRDGQKSKDRDQQSLFHRSPVDARTVPVQSHERIRPPVTTPAQRQTPTDAYDEHDETANCPIDYRGRPLCPDAMPTPQSLKKRSSELADAAAEFGHWVIVSTVSLVTSTPNFRHRITPFVLFVALMHALWLAELLAMATEDSIVRISLSNPLPARFTPAKSFAKQLSRAHWRTKAVLSRFWKQLAILATLFALTLALGFETGDLTKARNGWRDVPFAGLVCSATSLEPLPAKRSSPLRIVLLVEVVHAMLQLASPLKHILPESLVAPRTQAPLFLYERRPTERVLVETSWLVSGLLDMLSALLAISQFLVVCFSLPTFSPFSITLHVLGIGVRRHINAINKTLAGQRRTVNALDVVCSAFCKDSKTNDDSEGWTCTICFETDEEDANQESWSIKGRCQLPCGHHYHAGCIVHWLHYQAFCPVCHFKLDTSHLRPAEPVRPTPPWNHDVYPGNVRRRPVPSTSS